MMTPGEEFVGSLLPPKRIPQQSSSAHSDAQVLFARAGGSMNAILAASIPAEFPLPALAQPQLRFCSLPLASKGSYSC